MAKISTPQIKTPQPIETYFRMITSKRYVSKSNYVKIGLAWALGEMS